MKKVLDKMRRMYYNHIVAIQRQQVAAQAVSLSPAEVCA